MSSHRVRDPAGTFTGSCRNTVVSRAAQCNSELPLSPSCFHMSPKCVKLLFSIMGPRRHSHTANIHWLLMYHFGDLELELFSLETFSQLSHMYPPPFLSSSPSLFALYSLYPPSFLQLCPPLLPHTHLFLFLLLPSSLLIYLLFSTTSLEWKQMGSPGCETEKEANSHSQHEAGLGK